MMENNQDLKKKLNMKTQTKAFIYITKYMITRNEGFQFTVQSTSKQRTAAGLKKFFRY